MLEPAGRGLLGRDVARELDRVALQPGDPHLPIAPGNLTLPIQPLHRELVRLHRCAKCLGLRTTVLVVLPGGGVCAPQLSQSAELELGVLRSRLGLLDLGPELPDRHRPGRAVFRRRLLLGGDLNVQGLELRGEAVPPSPALTEGEPLLLRIEDDQDLSRLDLPPDREVSDEDPTVNLSCDGMGGGLNLEPGALRDLVDRDPRDEEPGDPDRREHPGSEDDPPPRAVSPPEIAGCGRTWRAWGCMSTRRPIASPGYAVIMQEA